MRKVLRLPRPVGDDCRVPAINGVASEDSLGQDEYSRFRTASIFGRDAAFAWAKRLQ